MGSRGARGGTAGGGALYLCRAGVARAKVLAIAAAAARPERHRRIAPAGRRGRAPRRRRVAGRPGSRSPTSRARAYLDPLRLPPGMEPGLESHMAYDPPPMTYSNSTHAVRGDGRPGDRRASRSSATWWRRTAARVLNPMVVEGQQHGAIAMGLSGCADRARGLRRSGQNLSGSFADYLLATAARDPADRDHVHAHAEPMRRRRASRACPRAASWARSAR